MRSLQSKFLALTVGCVLLSALALGYVGFIYTHKLVNEDSAQLAPAFRLFTSPESANCFCFLHIWEILKILYNSTV